MQDTLGLIIFCILFAFVWHIIMNSQRYTYENLFDEDEENLTMEEKPITIIIDNYCGQKITFTTSKDARIETLLSIDGSKVVGFDIDVRDDDILIEKEDI